ncbi:hypothetical protein ACHAXM_008946 [Skeletonema potamos]
MKIQHFVAAAAVLFSAFSGSVSAASFRGIAITADSADSADHYLSESEGEDYEFDYDDEDEDSFSEDMDMLSYQPNNQKRNNQKRLNNKKTIRNNSSNNKQTIKNNNSSNRHCITFRGGGTCNGHACSMTCINNDCKCCCAN